MKLNIKIYLLLISAFLFACNKGENKSATEEKKETGQELVILKPASIKEIDLKIDTVSFRNFNEIITIPAKVITNQDKEAQIGSLVQGRVKNVLVKAGDHVKQGQILMNIESLEIGVIKADFLKAKAGHDYYKANYERQKTLNEQNIGSQKSLLEAKSEYEKALAELKSEDKKIHAIGLSDEEILDSKNNSENEHLGGSLSIKSPIDGIITERNVVIGQLVDGSTTAFRIINTSSVWVDGQIIEKDLQKIKENATAYFKISSLPGETFGGKIIFIGQVIDEKTRKVTIRADFNNPGNKLKPQMFGDLQIPAGNNPNSIILPGESIIKINNADFVFVQKNDTTFEKRKVTVYNAGDGICSISEGLNAGEKVVIKGAFYLKSELLKSELGEE
jgi:membrane fusion protein, heavy metal efflux system